MQPWVSDAPSDLDGSLESSNAKSSEPWDQFAEHERRFGVTTDYHEGIYTTTIDKSHPQYRERMAAAERKAREIERSAPATAHVAEERLMDYQGGDETGGDEEDKYVHVVSKPDDEARTFLADKHTKDIAEYADRTSHLLATGKTNTHLRPGGHQRHKRLSRVLPSIPPSSPHS